jgi:hypothetical protein
MQKERATTIYEKSKTGRRAAVLPDAGVPETPIEDLISAAATSTSTRASTRSARAR